MSTLTISSGVYVNDDVFPTTRFSPISMSSVGVRTREKLYPQKILGMAGAVQPITFDITRFARKKVIDDLLPISATFVAREPRRTLDGSIDAVVNDGAELCKFEWQEVDRRSGSVYTQSEFGYFRIVNAQVDGVQESLQIVLFPVDRLRFVNTSTYLSSDTEWVISDLAPIMWFDANDESTVTLIPGQGGRISAWADKSGNGYDITQGTVLQSPYWGTRTINGLPAVEGDGVNDYLARTGTPTISQPNTILVVAKADVVGYNDVMIDSGGGAARQVIAGFGTPAYWSIYAGIIVSSTNATLDAALHTAVFDGASSTYEINGTQVAATNPGTSSLVGLTLFGDTSRTGFFDGLIGEFFAFDRVLTADELAKAEAWLAYKWGLTIS